MELKRYFRGPLLLVLLAVLVIAITLGWANSGSSYQSVSTSQIVKQIEDNQVKSAIITDKNQTIQVTLKTGQQEQADYVAGQQNVLYTALQKSNDDGQLPGGAAVHS
jgi:cell division protease FtsH